MVVGIRLFSNMSSAASWITALSCSCSNAASSERSSAVSIAVQWMRYIFLSPCPQRLIVSSIDLLFLITLLLFALQKLYSRLSSKRDSSSSAREQLLEKKEYPFKVFLSFKLSIFLTSLSAIGYTVLSTFSFIHSTEPSWKLVEAIFRISQTITHLAILILLVHEWKFRVAQHPLTLRFYWFANFVIASLFAASAIIRLVTIHDGNLDFNLRADDIFSLVDFLISIFFAVVSLRKSSGISAVVDSATSANGSHLVDRDVYVSDYVSASFLSRTLWLWMNPLLNKGYKSPLKLDEVPTLPPEFRSEEMCSLFERNWPKPEENYKHPVLITLFRCFWKDIVSTGLLALVRLSVMYIGPLLIQVFVSYTASETRSVSEGCVLVLILMLAKATEVVSSHHFQFHSQKLGMQIRASLVTSLYKKGLKLSCSSRQASGVGQIVNHMAVDAQQMADMMLQLHPIWMMPVQVGIALALIYGYLNVSMFAALIGLVAVGAFVLLRSKTNNMYQFLVMKSRDSRLKATNEMLNNMRVIKFLAWEEYFGKKIQSFRESEYGWLGKFMYSMSVNFALLGMSPLLIVSLTFGSAIFLGIPLNVGTAFTVSTIVKVLQEPVRSFPQSLIAISQALVALGRLDGFLRSKELDESSVEREVNCNKGLSVEIRNGLFSWDDEGGDFVLKVPNLEIKKGGLAAVVGTVGSGKSSLLASILGEMHKLSGKVKIYGSLAYVAQTSWIQNASIQDNILFGSPMHSQRYKEVISVCCLEKDLEMMDYGDQTEIGERGINLSGGQKQRIQLARAVYQDCDIYLLDDIFSAVDAQTGSEIFKECVHGALKDKTVVLVTHQVDFLHNADCIVVMRDGMIVQSGKYDELLESGMDFGALVAAHESSMGIVDMSDMSNGDDSMLPSSTLPSSSEGEAAQKKYLERSKSDKKDTSKIIEDEEKEVGNVRWEVYKQYCTEAYGWWGVIVITVLSLLWPLALMAGDYWLSYETRDTYIRDPSLFITVYLIIAVVACVLIFIRQFIVAYWGLVTAQSFFTGILGSIVHAPMSFFDTTPSGRILSRASTDQFNIDLIVPMYMSMLVVMYLTVVAVIFVTCQYVWPIIFLVIPLCWLNFWYRGYYLASSRELSRLDSITKAPVIHHFSETISGVMTIRGFKKQNSFMMENVNKVNANLRMDFHNNGANEWLGLRLEMFGISVLCTATLLMIFLPKSMIKPENVGLSLSYGLALNGIIFMTIYMSCSIENKMVSVERIKQFTDIPSEAPWQISNKLPPSNWPSRGDVVLADLQVRYRPNTPLVLKGISLRIHGGDKIGIVGRTGSGKSTLIQVFFRLIEPTGGQIIIDGIDICTLGLHDLRSRFGIIPQDPVLFEGTVRTNMDPLGLYSDEEIWKSLERCQLKESVAAKSEKLEAPVVDGGDNWSVGQRQLLCLGRIMLKRCKILFMDEATASVDSQTDAEIQKIIRQDFAECTIISIAHRIPTVMDCDKVLVVDEGWAKEFDKPSRLLERPSLFSALVQEYANRSSDIN